MESLVKLQGLNRTNASESAARNSGVGDDEIETVARHLRRLYASKYGPAQSSRSSQQGGALPGLGILYRELGVLLLSIDIELDKPPTASRRRELEGDLREIEYRLRKRLALLVDLPRGERERQVERDVIRVDQIDPVRIVVQEIEQIEDLLGSLDSLKMLLPF